MSTNGDPGKESLDAQLRSDAACYARGANLWCVRVYGTATETSDYDLQVVVKKISHEHTKQQSPPHEYDDGEVNVTFSSLSQFVCSVRTLFCVDARS
jgi:hypothetical protein